MHGGGVSIAGMAVIAVGIILVFLGVTGRYAAFIPGSSSGGGGGGGNNTPPETAPKSPGIKFPPYF